MEMYKRNKDFNALIKLIKTTAPDRLTEIYNHIGKEMETEYKFQEAEKYYSCCNNWKASLEMYK